MELVTDNFFSEYLDFDSLPDRKTIYLTYWGSLPSAEIKYSGKKLLIRYHDKEIERVHIKFNKVVKVLIFVIQGNPVDYDEQYIKHHQGHVTVETPEVYELNNILLALSDSFHQTNFKMHSIGEYFSEDNAVSKLIKYLAK